MCFVWISEQTAIISLYNINWLVFITESECVLLRGTNYICACSARLNRFVSSLRLSVAGVSPRRPRFDPGLLHVTFVVDEVALGRDFLSPRTSFFPCQYHFTNAPYPFIHLPPTLYNVSLPVLQFSPVSIIPPTLHTHSFTYHPRYIMFLSQYFSFPLSVSFHQRSIPIHSPTTHAI